MHIGKKQPHDKMVHKTGEIMASKNSNKAAHLPAKELPLVAGFLIT